MKGPNNSSNSPVRSSNYPPGAAIITRDRLKAQRPIFERWIAIAIIFLSYVGSFLGLFGEKPYEGAPIWRWVAWVLVPLLITALFQTLVTYAQWQYADARKRWRYLVPTGLSIVLSFKGWYAPVKWLVNFLADNWLARRGEWEQFGIVFLPLLIVVVVLDVWPERVLAGR